MGNIFAWFFFRSLLSVAALLHTERALFLSHATHRAATSRRRGDSVRHSMMLRTESREEEKHAEWWKSQAIPFKGIFLFSFSSHFYYHFILVVEFMRSDEVMPSKCVRMMRYDRDGRRRAHRDTCKRWKMTEQTHRVVKIDVIAPRLSSTYVLRATFISVRHFGGSDALHSHTRSISPNLHSLHSGIAVVSLMVPKLCSKAWCQHFVLDANTHIHTKSRRTHMNVDYVIQFGSLFCSHTLLINLFFVRLIFTCYFLFLSNAVRTHTHTQVNRFFPCFSLLSSFTFDSIEHYFTILHNRTDRYHSLLSCSLSLLSCREIQLRNWMDFLEIFVEIQLLLCATLCASHSIQSRLQPALSPPPLPLSSAAANNTSIGRFEDADNVSIKCQLFYGRTHSHRSKTMKQDERTSKRFFFLLFFDVPKIKWIFICIHSHDVPCGPPSDPYEQRRRTSILYDTQAAGTTRLLSRVNNTYLKFRIKFGTKTMDLIG